MWGSVEDQLIELRVEPVLSSDGGFRVAGLPASAQRATADRVRAALLNSGLAREAPAVVVRMDPPLRTEMTSELDLAIALAVLAWAGAISVRHRWIFARGRLRLDGTVHLPGELGRGSLSDAARYLCQTLLVGSEHMFEQEA